MTGFVFGKYYPMHNGHRALIEFALSKCDHVTVIVCASDNENINGAIRAKWISETFRDRPLSVITFDYSESDLPNTSVPSPEASQAWAEQFKQLVPECDVVITSEAYGPMVAEAMGIQHISFDVRRTQNKISASAIRNDLHAHWPFLPEAVKHFFVTKVSIGGSESTGKTTLAQKLRQHYHCTLINETGRELIPDSNSFTQEDLHRVALTHAEGIRLGECGTSPILIADTDVFITQSYSRFSLRQELHCSDEILSTNKFDLHLYLCNDAEFVQDGTRFSEEQRNLLDISHRNAYRRANIRLTELSGSWEHKFRSACNAIDETIDHKLHVIHC